MQRISSSSEIRNMSYRNYSSGSSSSSKSPFCKVCKDAGLPVANYTSHYVKDQPGPNGKVVCPTLLNQSCRTCNAKGHTSSYCTQRIESSVYDRQLAQPARDYVRAPPASSDRKYRNYNSYSALQEQEIQSRDSKTWAQAVAAPVAAPYAPYAHPHGPRTRLQLEAPALSVASVTPATSYANDDEEWPEFPADIRNINLKHSEKWCDEHVARMTVSEVRKIVEDSFMSYLVSDRDLDFLQS
jgi:hypothetical protein